jgi:hypothetical protein
VTKERAVAGKDQVVIDCLVCAVCAVVVLLLLPSVAFALFYYPAGSSPRLYDASRMRCLKSSPAELELFEKQTEFVLVLG